MYEFLLEQGFKPETLALLSKEGLAQLADEYYYNEYIAANASEPDVDKEAIE